MSIKSLLLLNEMAAHYDLDYGNENLNKNDKYLDDLFKETHVDRCTKYQAAKKFILETVKKGEHFGPKIIDFYILYFCYGYGIGYGPFEDTGHKKKDVEKYINYIDENHNEQLRALLNFSCPNKNSLMQLLQSGYIKLIEEVIHKNYPIDVEVLEYCFGEYEYMVKNYDNPEERWRIEDIISLLCHYKNVERTIEHTKKMAAMNDKDLNSLILKENEPSIELLKIAIESSNFELTDTLLNKGLMLDNSLLVTASSVGNYNIIKKLLDLKLAPTSACFKEICKSKYPPIGKRLDKVFAGLLIEMLLESGYHLTYDDVIYAAQYRIPIADYARYDIKLDDQIYEACFAKNSLPYSLNMLNLTNKSLVLACSRPKNLKEIREMIKFGLKLNNRCLYEACCHNGNMETINFLIKKCLKLNYYELLEIKLKVNRTTFESIVRKLQQTYFFGIKYGLK